MGKVLALSLMLCFVFSPLKIANSAEAKQFELDFGGWFTELNNQVKSGKGASNIDVSSNLGLDGRKTIFPVSASIHLGGQYSLFADFYSYSISGNKVLTRDINYHQVDFVATTSTSSKYSQDALRGGIKYNLTSKTDTDFFFELGMLYYKLQLDISSDTVSTSDSMNVPFPFLGFEMRNEIAPNFSWGALFEGMLFSFQDNSTTYLNFDLYMDYMVVDNVSIRTSYRYENLDAEKEEVNFNSEAKGFYLGLSARF